MNDVVKITRCKDCIHRPIIEEDEVMKAIIPPKDVDGYTDYTCVYTCYDSFYNRMPEDDFFCAFGERKEKKC